jgi:outer membrane lipoprotein carrier protein
VAASTGTAQDSSTGLEVMERAGARYRGIQALCADFRQVIDVRLLGEIKHSHGRMCQQPPNLFLMDFTEPEGDLVVADGESLWIYYPSTDPKQVFRAELAGGSAGLDFHREFLSEPGKRYTAVHEGSEMVDGLALEKIAVQPTSPASYERAWVWIDDATGLIHRVVLEEENGSVRRIDLSAIEVDPSLDPDLFAFTPPAGAAILQR